MQHYFLFHLLAAAATNCCISFKVTHFSLRKQKIMDSCKELGSHPSSSSSRLYTTSNYDVDTTQGDAVLHAGLKESVRRVINHWNYADDEISVRSLKGGITNLLYTLTPNKMEDKTIIVRIYGKGTSLFVDRATENIVFSSLSARRIGPKFYGTFSNGRVEGYCDARTLTPAEMRDDTLYPKTSMAIAKLHAQSITEINQTASLWTKMDSFFDLAENAISNHQETNGNSGSIPQGHTLSEMREQSYLLRKSLAEEEANLHKNLAKVTNRAERRKIEGALHGFQVVLCHNDLLSGNILLYNNVTNTKSSTGSGLGLGLGPESESKTTQYSLEEKNNGSWSPELLQSSSKRVITVRDNQVQESQGDDTINLKKDEIDDTEGITLIDFEYAGYNCRAWDIANHFNEFAGFDFNIEKDFPSKERRLLFLKHYVKGVARNGSGSNSGSGSNCGSGSNSGSGSRSTPVLQSELSSAETFEALEDIVNDNEDFDNFVSGYEVCNVLCICDMHNILL